MVYSDRNLAYDIRLFEEEVVVPFSKGKQAQKVEEKPEKKNTAGTLKRMRHKIIKRRKL